ETKQKYDRLRAVPLRVAGEVVLKRLKSVPPDGGVFRRNPTGGQSNRPRTIELPLFTVWKPDVARRVVHVRRIHIERKDQQLDRYAGARAVVSELGRECSSV